jgi:hypothetical protein
METIVENAQLLVYSLLALMPSPYQKASDCSPTYGRTSE